MSQCITYAALGYAFYCHQCLSAGGWFVTAHALVRAAGFSESPMPFGGRLVCHAVASKYIAKPDLMSPMPFGGRLVCHPIRRLWRSHPYPLSPMPFGGRLVCHELLITDTVIQPARSPMPFGGRLVCHQWLIVCPSTKGCWGLTWADDVTMNGREEDFFIGEK